MSARIATGHAPAGPSRPATNRETRPSPDAAACVALLELEGRHVMRPVEERDGEPATSPPALIGLPDVGAAARRGVVRQGRRTGRGRLLQVVQRIAAAAHDRLRRRRPGRENRQALISAEADLTGIALPALATFTVGGLSTGPKNPENENGSRPAIAKAENEVAIPQIRWLTRSGDP